MKTLLIIYPHWPPSNLVGVHRVRLIANELSALGWHPIVLTVHEDHYEEPHDPLAEKLVDDSVEVIKTRAHPVLSIGGKRLIGDIGLRAFFNLKKAAIKICQERRIDGAWISIPSWYSSLIGNALHRKGVPYGIDYQDPWVHELPKSVSALSRARWTVFLARTLEPIAVKNAEFITGINGAYFRGCLERNPHLKRKPQGELQLGFSSGDHAHELPELVAPWKEGERIFIYAGAYLPLSTELWEALFDALARCRQNGNLPENVRFYLFGTGSSLQRSLASMAQKKSLEDFIIEHPERIPFLHVQEFMRRAEGVISIGSTEPHYSASKTFQCLLSGNKVFSVCHGKSEAREILQRCEADAFHTDYYETFNDLKFVEELSNKLERYFAAEEKFWTPALNALHPYSATESARALIKTIEAIDCTI